MINKGVCLSLLCVCIFFFFWLRFCFFVCLLLLWGIVFLNCCFYQYFMRVLTGRDSLSCMEALQGIYFRLYPPKLSTFMLTATDVPLLLPLSGCNHHFQDSVTSRAGRGGAGTSFPLKVVLVGNCGEGV